MKNKNSLLAVSLAFLLTLCMAFTLAGCGGNAEKKASSEDTSSTVEQTETTRETTPPKTNEKYNISKGLTLNRDGDNAVLSGNGFQLTMPNTGTWSYKVNEESSSIEIYYLTAEESGFGGNLMTLMVFDQNDTSYENFPDYTLAGTSKTYGKSFVALFPTDVQFNPEDKTQEREYTELANHVQAIRSGGSGSPLLIK